MSRSNKNIAIALAVAGLLCAAGPVVGYVYVFNYLQQASSPEAIHQLFANGLTLGGIIYVLGVFVLGAVAYVMHDVDHIEADNGGIAIGGSNWAPLTISIPPVEAKAAGELQRISDMYAAERTRIKRSPISLHQWNDILSWAAVDDDVKAITERYDFVNGYELVDTFPDSYTADGRYVPDISINFMYPRGARAAAINTSNTLSSS